jgi:hypothetical protein
VAVKGSVTVNDKVFQELRKRIGKSTSHVKVGVLSSRGGDVKHDDAGISLVELAAIHEFGSPAAGIPERSFIRRTFEDDDGKQALIQFLAKLAKRVISGELTHLKALEVLGLWAEARVKSRVAKGIAPPNKPATIKAKGSSKPLVDTSQLINSVASEVIE